MFQFHLRTPTGGQSGMVPTLCGRFVVVAYTVATRQDLEFFWNDSDAVCSACLRALRTRISVVPPL